MNISVRDAQNADLEWVLKINNAAVPHVNRLTAEELAQLAAMAAYFRIARHGDKRAGFLLGLFPQATYGSANFLWFKQRYPQFLYIDRVVIAAATRRLGVGRVLYADVISFAELNAPLLTCEVNLQPANPASLVFHSSQGFSEVGQQEVPDTDKRVSLLARKIPSYAFVSPSG